MTRKQLAILFATGLVLWIIANGLLPLLPVYAAQLGAEISFIGTFLSFSFLALAVSTMLAGWLSDQFQQRKQILVVAGLLHSVVLFLLSQVTNVWQFAALITLEWFLFGMGLSLINILAGLFAGEAERGKIFGILALTGGFGLLIGGLVFGRIADSLGYSTLLLYLAVFSLLWPIMGIFVEDKHMAARPAPSTDEKVNRSAALLDRRLLFFLISFTLAWIGFFMGRLGTSYIMEEQGYSSAAVSSTGAVAGALTLPVPFILGWLSDRLDRRSIIMICFLSAAIGLGILSVATEIWQFWMVASLLTLISAVVGVGSAYMTDVVPKTSLGLGLSLFTSTSWIAGIISSAGTGFAIQNLGFGYTIAVGALLPLTAIGFLYLGGFKIWSVGPKLSQDI